MWHAWEKSEIHNRLSAEKSGRKKRVLLEIVDVILEDNIKMFIGKVII